MSLRLYDTATRDVRDFVPRTPGEVGIYLCGATVQASPHVGHLRPAVAFDVLRRWLERSDLRVTLVRNVTDIEDKILAKAAAAGVEWWAHAATYEREFARAYDALGVLPPTYEPRATGHVPDMTALMERLVERGHAYTTGPGDVWFDVRSWPAYGELTRQRLEDLNPEPSDDDGQSAGAKRDPHDFALWKAPKPGEPATAAWDTPFGRGRPGWHLECSAMAQRYLGDTFDIHGGGLDLRFPHHENEQAQSRAAGFGFAQRWMHSAWVTQSGVKMSKSLGNGLLVSELLAQVPAPVVRYALAAVQYRSMLEWSPDTLDEARSTWERLSGFVERATERVGAVAAEEVRKAELPPAFVAAMDDDLNVPAALAVVHEHLRAGNSALAERDDTTARTELVALRAMLDVLGLDPADPQWAAGAGDSRARAALDALVSAELEARAAARAAKDWATGDAIRDRLAAAGVVVQDSADGARWTLEND
ncbi:cysteine--tRNA ligase [Isoptericola sp. BMS4]|uniref:cysteine--tRNA ligase n=1 Tax=Isoptericola sp. BMS4 TaxID=2527875 RepID=UPI001423FAF0|nr:cysteine--tRNA ligase [Isoptericola sp. BMS4]